MEQKPSPWLGGTEKLPDPYEAAGVRFAFDAEALRGMVDLMDETIGWLANS